MGIKDLTVTDGIESVRYHRPERELSRENIFKVLSNDRRRCTIYFLKQHENETVPLRDIVDYVAAWENGVSIEQLDSNSRKCVYTALRQSHLPKLDDMGVIDYDHLRGEARLTDCATDVQMYLEYVPGNDIPWHQYYLGISAIISALAALTWLGIFPFGELGWSVLAVIVILLLTVSAIIHTLSARNHRLDAERAFSITE